MNPSFDPTLKALVETSPADWLALLGLRPAPVSVLDADVATVLAGAADKVLHVHADPDYLVHLDFQAGHDSARLPERLWLYNTSLDVRHDLPVQSVAVVLRPAADSPRLTGRLERRLPGAEVHSSFGYRVLRVWEVPVERFLAGGVGTLPLAPLGALGDTELPGVIRKMRERLRRGRRRRQAAEVWAATYVLLGLRFTREVARVLLREVVEMKESVTYQDIVEEGRAEGLAAGKAEGLAAGKAAGKAEGKAEGSVEEARRFLLRLGGKRFGTPDDNAVSAVLAIADVQRLEELGERLLEAKSWQELLGLPPGRTRRRKDRR